ncbi:MAG TPA: ATP-binding protein [Anaerolineae bacterium]|nr:ATP-binding protein [Anaerolineae bacterium]
MFSLPFVNKHQKDGLLLGHISRYNFSPKFYISSRERKFHTYVVGLTGRGKSKFLQNCILQDIIAGRGCAVIDPHGDLAKDVLKSLIARNFFQAENVLDRILYVSPRRRDYIVPFNVLARPDANTETYEVSQRVIGAFMRTWARTLLEPPRFQQIMRSSLATLIENGETLCSLYRLLTDDDFRTAQLQSIRDPKVSIDCNTFFQNEFDKWGRERTTMMSSTTNKVSALTDNPSIFYMLGQKENHINISQIMDEGKFLLVDLGDCDDETKRLFGTLIVTGFEQAALSRARTSSMGRKPYYLYIDEFQDFACHPGAAATFSQMLSQVRKFGLHMILANQSIAQLSPGLQTALGNAQTIIAFRISRDDAEALARVLGEVNTLAVKHDSQTSTQHPVFAPILEQWESYIQHLTRQQVRQATVKTSDDRLAIIWPEKVKDSTCTPEQFEIVISASLKRNGHPFTNVFQRLVQQTHQNKSNDVFAN